jgi:hypothetical protein
MAVMGAGAALSIFGQLKANSDEAAAHWRNYEWMQEQEQFLFRQQEREERLFRNEANAVMGQQQAMAGGLGLEASGSVLDVLNSTYAEAQDEIAAIRDNAKMQRMQMNFNMTQVKDRAKQLGSASYNLTQAATIGLGAASSMLAYSSGTTMPKVGA